MAAPVLASKGTVSIVTTNAPAPTYPASVVANDVVLLQIVKFDNSTTPTITTPANFNLITTTDLLSSGGAKVGIVGWYWRRATGALSGTVTVTTSGATGNSTICIGQMYRITGCRTAGNPFDNFIVDQNSGSSAYTWDQITEYHAVETLTGLFGAGAGAGLTAPATPANVTASTAADTTTTGADGFQHGYRATTPAEPTVGPFASATSRAQWCTIAINFVSAAYVGQTLKSGTDNNGTVTETVPRVGIKVAEGGTSTVNTGGLLGSSASSVAAGTVPWTNPTEVLSDDATAATIILNDGEFSEMLKVSGFGFSFPGDAVINGMEVLIDYEANAADVAIWNVRLDDDAQFSVGANLGSGAALNLTRQVYTYGGLGDPFLLGAFPIADVASGLVINVQLANVDPSFAVTNCFVYSVKLRVYYTTLTGANGVSESGGVVIGGGTTPKSGTDANGTPTETAIPLGVHAAVQVNGTTTETGIPIGVHATSDANGTTTENSSVTSPVSGSDANGTTTDTGTPKAAYTQADSNLTSENSVNVSTYVGSDVNGSVETGVGQAVYTVADVNGATTEISTITVPIAGSDSNGVTTEIGSESAAFTQTDVNGATTEVISQIAVESAADSNGATTETGRGGLSGSDSGGSVENAVPTVNYIVTDSGSDSETASYTFILTPVADTGAGSDASVLNAAYTVADSGSDSEAITLVVRITDTQTGSDFENATTNTPINGADTNGVTTEFGTASIGSNQLTVSDTGLGTDTSTLNAVIAVAETDISTDTVTLKAVYTQSDLGAGVDTASTALFVFVTDSGAGSDVSALTAALSGLENGSGIEAFALKVALALQDAGIGADNGFQQYLISVLDSGAGSDFSRIEFLVADSGTDSEFATANNLGFVITVSENVVFVDSAVLEILVPGFQEPAPKLIMATELPRPEILGVS